LDGKASAVVGTHTHVATADERILPGGTAYISDLGMTGPHESILGRKIDCVLKAINGVKIVVDSQSGRAESIKRIEVKEAS